MSSRPKPTSSMRSGNTSGSKTPPNLRRSGRAPAGRRRRQSRLEVAVQNWRSTKSLWIWPCSVRAKKILRRMKRGCGPTKRSCRALRQQLADSELVRRSMPWCARASWSRVRWRPRRIRFFLWRSPIPSGSELTFRSPIWAKFIPGWPPRSEWIAFPKRSFDGWIGFISPVAEFTPKSVQTEELRTSLVYEVRVFVKDPKDELRLGMPASVYFLLNQRKSAAKAGRSRAKKTAKRRRDEWRGEMKPTALSGRGIEKIFKRNGERSCARSTMSRLRFKPAR